MNSKYEYLYKVGEQGWEHGPYAVQSHFSSDNLDRVAEDAAEDYHSHHDGWESQWPLVFRIFNKDELPLGKFEVEREAVPSFSASLLD